MPIPKLKVYRLSADIAKQSSNATTNIISDVQHIQGEELLPFVLKDNDAAQSVRKLVGVERTPDNFLRVVKRIDDTNGVIVAREEDDQNNQIVKTEQILVNDWIVSQHNIQVWASKQEEDQDDWEQVSNSQFRYELRTQKGQGYDAQGNVTDITSDIDEYHDDLYMRIYIGNTFFTDNNKSSYKTFMIKCPRIQELSNSNPNDYSSGGNTNATNSQYGLNKGEIYNGTKTGVYKDTNGIKGFDEINGQGIIIPHYYEGNYFYQIKYYPLRIKWIDNASRSNGVSIQELPSNIDKIFTKLQVFEERIGSNNIYYQKLISQQYSINNNIINFTDYYRNNKYPKKVGVVYNLIGERLNVNFEQDYHYSNSNTRNNENRGVIFSEDGIVFKHDTNGYYLIQREEKLAVREGYGKDENDLLLTISNQTVTFTIPNPNFISDGVSIFDNGQPISNSRVAISGSNVTITYPNGAKLPYDLLVSYNYKMYIKDDIQGIRAIGTIKQRTADTFVATHPMWVTNHLYQSPDVFIGNTIYSGTTTTSYASDGLSPHYIEHNEYALSADVGSVELNQPITEMDYNYIRNFAVQISTVITSTDLSSVYQYLNYVTANYAFYDSIYMVYQGKFSCYTKQGGCHYALLTDELFDDCKYKKFITLGDAQGFFKTFYKGNAEMPKIQNIEREQPVKLNIETDAQINFSKDKRILVKKIAFGTNLPFTYEGSNIVNVTYTTNGLQFSNNDINTLTYFGDAIWHGEKTGNVISIPKFQTMYDMSNSDTMRNNMPTVIYTETDWSFQICFETFYFGKAQNEEFAYVAVYKKMKGNTL